MPNATFDTSSSGATVVVAAQGVGRRIQLLGFVVTGYGDVEAAFQDSTGTPVVFTQIRIKDGGGAVTVPTAEWGWVGGDNKSLDISLSDAVNVVGNITYRVLFDGSLVAAFYNSLDFSDSLNSMYIGSIV